MPECEHENLWYEPGPVIRCVRCDCYFLGFFDVSKIRNIQHYDPIVCEHPEEIIWKGDIKICLNCGTIS